jgi:chitodextrinase
MRTSTRLIIVIALIVPALLLSVPRNEAYWRSIGSSGAMVNDLRVCRDGIEFQLAAHPVEETNLPDWAILDPVRVENYWGVEFRTPPSETLTPNVLFSQTPHVYFRTPVDAYPGGPPDFAYSTTFRLPWWHSSGQPRTIELHTPIYDSTGNLYTLEDCFMFSHNPTPDDDAYVAAVAPDETYGTQPIMRVGGVPENRAYLRFTVTGVTGPVARAALRLSVVGTSSAGIDVHLVDDPSWSEGSITYATAPAIGPAIASSGPIGGTGWIEIDVSELVPGNGTFGLALTSNDATQLEIRSSEDSEQSYQPQLIVQPDRPTAPYNLVAIAGPSSEVELHWEAARDDNMVAAYTIYRDGAVLNTVSGDSTSYADASATPLSTHSYTVDAVDVAGNHSDPSNQVTFTRPEPYLTFLPIDDTYVDSAQPTATFGTAMELQVGGSLEARAYLRFDVRGIGDSVTKAVLRLRTGSSTDIGLRVHSVAGNWDEATYYDSAPPIGAEIASSTGFHAGGIRAWIEIDLTSHVTRNGIVNLSLTSVDPNRIVIDSVDVNGEAWRREPPQLVIETRETDPPSMPTTLAATQVGPTQVELRWDAATDNVGVAGYTIYRNGTELTTVPGDRLVYSDTTVAPNGTYTYSVDAFDAAGNRSAQSAAVTITVQPPMETPAAIIRTWERTDRPVKDIGVKRTWMWGPESRTPAMTERYTESPSGIRTVQYYDKSRMEITDPNKFDDGLWYVSNGLLVVELMSGRLQLGDNTFEQRTPANVNVAGDPDDPTGPTYATLANTRAAPPLADGQVITQRIDRAGNVTDDPSLAGRGVTAATYVPETNHRVASPFWDFMTSSGTVYEDGAYTTDLLFPNAFYATGFPITEAYWAHVRVAGESREVLMQCFERRCLTYTPGNPEGWQVEAGNVGQHYYRWRYSGG